MMMCAAAPVSESVESISFDALEDISVRLNALEKCEESKGAPPVPTRSLAPPPAPTGPLDMEVIKLQSANGSWGSNALNLIGFTAESPVED